MGNNLKPRRRAEINMKSTNWLSFHKKSIACSLSFVSWPEMTGKLQPQCWEDRKSKQSVKMARTIAVWNICPAAALFLMPLSMETWLREAWSKQPSWLLFVFQRSYSEFDPLGWAEHAALDCSNPNASHVSSRLWGIEWDYMKLWRNSLFWHL